jgi:hypothetical protein
MDTTIVITGFLTVIGAHTRTAITGDGTRVSNTGGAGPVVGDGGDPQVLRSARPKSWLVH